MFMLTKIWIYTRKGKEELKAVLLMCFIPYTLEKREKIVASILDSESGLKSWYVHYATVHSNTPRLHCFVVVMLETWKSNVILDCSKAQEGKSTLKLKPGMSSRKIFCSTPSPQNVRESDSQQPNPKNRLTLDSSSLSRKIFRLTPNNELCPQNC